MRRGGLFAALVLGGALGGCDNAGEERVLAIRGIAVVEGTVYVDRDGDRQPSSGDTIFAGLRLGLRPVGSRVIVEQAISDAQGGYRLVGVPVGTYLLVVDSTTLPDSLPAVRLERDTLALDPGDSVIVAVTVSFPFLTPTEARALAPGVKAFVEGVALNGTGTFGDTTLHLADGQQAIRATRVASSPGIAAGDSVRLLGQAGSRDGQPTLDRARPFLLRAVGLPPAERLVTGVAARADGGRLDANQATVVDATVRDSTTIGGTYRVVLDDGSGPLVLALGPLISQPRLTYRPGVVVTATGLLVPDGSGAWVLRPRSDRDLVVR